MPKEPSKRTRFETGLRLLNRPIRHLRFKSVASWRNGTTKHYRASAAIDGHLLRPAVKVGRTTRFSMAHLRLRAGSRRPLRESSPRKERGESPQSGAKPGGTLDARIAVYMGDDQNLAGARHSNGDKTLFRRRMIRVGIGYRQRITRATMAKACTEPGVVPRRLKAPLP